MRGSAKMLKRRLIPAAIMTFCLLAPAHLLRAAEAAAGEAKGELVPTKLDNEVILQAVWVIIIFVILLAILYPTAWKNVLAGLKKREERIRKDIADAEAARAKADATLKQYNQQLAAAEAQVRDLLSKAAADAEKIGAGIRMHAQQES